MYMLVTRRSHHGFVYSLDSVLHVESEPAGRNSEMPQILSGELIVIDHDVGDAIFTRGWIPHLQRIERGWQDIPQIQLPREPIHEYYSERCQYTVPSFP